MKSLKRGQDLTRFWWVDSKWHFAYCVQILPRVIFFCEATTTSHLFIGFFHLNPRLYTHTWTPCKMGFSTPLSCIHAKPYSWAPAHEPPIFFPSKVLIPCDFIFLCVIIIHKNKKTNKNPSSYKSCVGHLKLGVLHYKFRIFIWIV